MQSSDPYQKIITALQNAKPIPVDAAGQTNSIIAAIEEYKADKQKSRIYYLFRNVTVSAAAMLAGVFIYQTFLIDDVQPQAISGIAINVEVDKSQAVINQGNLVQSLTAYIYQQKAVRDKLKRNIQDYTFININQR
jgi:hypothetical protein